MIIGVPKERKRDEMRVALRPDQVSSLTKEGHEIFVEASAGEKSGYHDADYEKAGARIVEQEEVYEKATLIVKVKCPLESEYKLYGDNHILFTFLHFDENIPALNIERIVSTGVTAIAYEWVEHNGKLPLLEPMSELTGAVFARKAMSLLIEHKGVLGSQYLKDWPVGHAMVIGAGRIGCNAINVFARNEFKLTVIDKHPETLGSRLRRYIPIEIMERTELELLRFDEDNPDHSLATIRPYFQTSDIVILSAVRRPTLPKEKCEYLIRREDVANMAKGSVLCDATACDYDLAETCISSDSVSYTYAEEGVIHYNCDHIPALVPSTATRLLTDATFPYVRSLSLGLYTALSQEPALVKAVMCYSRHLTHKYSAGKKGLEYTDLTSLL